MSHAGGRPPVDERRRDYRQRFGLTNKQSWELSVPELDRLDRCADDMARRIMLRVAEDGQRTCRDGNRTLGVGRRYLSVN